LVAAQEKTATAAVRKEGRMTSVDLKPAQQTRVPGWFATPVAQMIFLGIVLELAVVGVYSPVHWQPFANYDDPDYVTDNFHVKAGLHWETVKWALTARDAANWHPVTWVSHALDTSLFGLNPTGPHDVNVLLHIVNALLLFWVLQRATGFIGRSWMVAALFALHPINVETVAWIAERKNLLSMFFFLLALAAYRWYATKPQLSRYLVVALLFALGLMSKPQVITLPFVLLLWDYWPLGRLALRSSPSALRQNSSGEISGEERTAKSEWRWLLLEKVPLLALCAISAVLTLNAQAGGGATSHYGHVLPLENAFISYVRYLAKAFWPARLALFYPYPLKPYPVWQVGGAAFILLAITLAVVLAHRRRYLTVGWLWFLGTLVPMIGLVQVGTQAMADRYAYLPFVGLFIMVCWLVAELVCPSQEMASTGHLQPARLSAALLGVSVVVLLALAIVSFRQVNFWSDHITLWTHTLEVTHDNWVAENNLGTALLKTGRMDEAIPHFRAAAALDPTDPNSTMNIGTYEQMHGNLPAAIELYGKAARIARNPKVKARAYNNLAYAYKESGNFADARASFEEAVITDPEFVGAWISLGLVAQNAGDLPLAIRSYSQAMQISPSDFGYLLLAGALEASGDKTHAARARQKAILISNNISAAQRHADKLLAQ
jgi:tetratricopeptide (TPR) repeat protein